MKNHTTFKQIVDAALDELELPRRRLGSAIRICVRGYRRVARNISPALVTRWFTLDPDLRFITLPPDYDHYTKIGLVVRNGYGHDVIMTLSRNDRLVSAEMDLAPKNKVPECNCSEPDSPAAMIAMLSSPTPFGYSDWSVYHNGYRNGQWVGELYGMEGGVSQWGVYRPREDQNRVYFSPEVPTGPDYEIIMEYVPIGLDEGASTRIPYAYEEYLLAYVKYHLMSGRNSTRGERMEAKDRMDELEMEAINYAEAKTYDEWLDFLDNINNQYG